jgi:cytochrome c-type biogenesis protein
LGVPFVASGVAFSRFASVFGWARRHTRVINVVAGGLLVAFGLLLLTNQVGWLAGRLIELMEWMGLGGLTRI